MTRAAPAPGAAGLLRERAAALAALADRGGEPRAVHDLRVECRRLEVALRLWARGHAARAARVEARAIRRAAGPAREHEVLRAMLRARRNGAAALPSALRHAWLARLATVAEGDPPVTWPAPIELARLARRVERVARGLAEEPELLARAGERVRRWRVSARARLAAGLASGDVESLHRARLALKRWRYAEEARAAAAGERARPGTAARLEALRRWQRTLGELNDRALLIAHASRSCPEAQPFAARLEALRQARLRSLRRVRDAVARRPRARAPRAAP